MTEQTSSVNSALDNARTVENFLYAVGDQNFDAAEALATDDLVWENVGCLTVRGSRRVMRTLQSLPDRSQFEIKIHRIAADGDAVLVERSDALVLGRLRVQGWVCGVFEVHEGKITLWRDYFDYLDLLKGTLRGIAGVFIPSLRRTM
jgi:limonene-1,2-epoxide hydrolase